MRDSLDLITRPVGQFMVFLKCVSWFFILSVVFFLIIIYLLKWINIDYEKIKTDLGFTKNITQKELLIIASDELQKHKVRPGESLPIIARDYNISWLDLVEDNHITDYSNPEPGTILLIRRR